jgi:hypothetical protein
MANQRFDRIEKELGSMEEWLKKHLDEMMAALAIKLEPIQGEDQGNSAGSSKSRAGKEPTRTESGSSFPKVAKLNFPKYDGTEDPTSWVCHVEQFFDFQNTAEEYKVLLAAYHLEGEAQLWYQLFKETKGASLGKLEGRVTWKVWSYAIQRFFWRPHKIVTNRDCKGVSKAV